MKVMMVGDTHGNIYWLRTYIYPVAVTVGADLVVVLGDFGAWEHTPAGVAFFDSCDELAKAAGIPLYWLHGNHDKWSHTMATYGRQRDPQGFVRCRENLFYIPQGHSWEWDGLKYRSFGGAYSIDASWRIEEEKERYRRARQAAQRKIGKGDLFTSDMVPSTAGTLWFPEEEMTDDEMEQLLRDDWYGKDIILSHDKPLSAYIPWNRRSIPACVPNQLRLDRALKTHRPEWWLHGHMHYHYVDTVHHEDGGTIVMGLDPDHGAKEHDTYRREHSWALVDTAHPCGGNAVTLGSGMGITEPDILQATIDLHVKLEH